MRRPGWARGIDDLLKSVMQASARPQGAVRRAWLNWIGCMIPSPLKKLLTHLGIGGYFNSGLINTHPRFRDGRPVPMLRGASLTWRGLLVLGHA